MDAAPAEHRAQLAEFLPRNSIAGQPISAEEAHAATDGAIEETDQVAREWPCPA